MPETRTSASILLTHICTCLKLASSRRTLEHKPDASCKRTRHQSWPGVGLIGLIIVIVGTGTALKRTELNGRSFEAESALDHVW